MRITEHEQDFQDYRNGWPPKSDAKGAELMADDDPGHLLPQDDWDKVVAEAERIQREREDDAG